MDPDRVRELLEQVRTGAVSTDGALERLRDLPFSTLDYAQLDHHRALRTGLPEVVFGEGKTVEQIVGIAERILKVDQNVIVTRVSAEKAGAVRQRVPLLRYAEEARMLLGEIKPVAQRLSKPVAVVTAGTSDIPVAEEAAETLCALGIPVDRVFDVGVAGLHRLLAHVERLRAAAAVIVVAGMEGALPSVVGGLVGNPVIAVPTSIGYGAALGGFTALLGMLTSCAAGVMVVNIDNGFGAAMAAARIVSVAPAQIAEGNP